MGSKNFFEGFSTGAVEPKQDAKKFFGITLTLKSEHLRSSNFTAEACMKLFHLDHHILSHSHNASITRF